MSKKSLLLQEGALKSYFPESQTTRKGERELTWVGVVTPTPLSNTYTLKLHYRYNEGVKVYVIDPQPLTLAEGKRVLPHVYRTPEQELCLYYPIDKEWDAEMFYVHTLIPWACEWLCHYELWVCTGTWHGGGIEHETEDETQVDKQKETTNEAYSNRK